MYLKTILIMVLSFLPVVMPAAEIDDNIDGMALSGRRISSVDGLSGNTVYDLLQDKDGFVWMGAAYGLCRYDGYSFVNYYSLSSDRKRKMDATTGNLYMDEPNNMLWIHSSTFAFACYDLHSDALSTIQGVVTRHGRTVVSCVRATICGCMTHVREYARLHVIMEHLHARTIQVNQVRCRAITCRECSKTESVVYGL